MLRKLQFLRRMPYYNQQWRLDRVLKRKAEAGVKIYVIVYKEVIHFDYHASQALCWFFVSKSGFPEGLLAINPGR